jgi:hypothetical protein
MHTFSQNIIPDIEFPFEWPAIDMSFQHLDLIGIKIQVSMERFLHSIHSLDFQDVEFKKSLDVKVDMPDPSLGWICVGGGVVSGHLVLQFISQC